MSGRPGAPRVKKVMVQAMNLMFNFLKGVRAVVHSSLCLALISDDFEIVVKFVERSCFDLVI